MKKTNWIPLSLGALLIAGCGSNPETASQSEPKSEIASVNTTASTQPVATSLQLPSDPKEVVRLFLDSMRQGNGAQLSALLSSAAREEIKRRNMEIDPLGSPQASFQIVDAAAQGDGMLVSTLWTEPEQAGQPATELEVVWELRKEPSGWRICGMAVDPNTGEEIQVVNFEHMEPEPAAPQPRMASLPNAPVNGAPNLPASNMPGQANQQTLPNAFNASPAMPSMPSNPQYQGIPNNGSGGFQPNAGQPAMPPIVPSSSQLPPIQQGNFQLPAGIPNQPAPQPPMSNGGFQLPPPSGNYNPR